MPAIEEIISELAGKGTDCLATRQFCIKQAITYLNLHTTVEMGA